ncbi:hypothetical protein JX265_005556 [Neoarthrinium moseri]|uniref:Uncharacterized protein n=1 Tax=Neoarthrinium moseri TaxID=1658444 RepID=A0A9Q0AQ91_9PEZI|nr:uncharacterized protein JN550_010283 [Neoarthrinium moseri]KAI1847384.1 hypothetical protein JX266_006609 [Neoarthrinium moseri]KAI1862276.1 hypothetical protein JN550_010283 [Neoarthrinium moseri]KAI1872676.1 hypothetical protein JX265_005556 [Neoarthrinium moseri]
MIVSTPRLNLRRAASYTGVSIEKLPLSATSSSFKLDHLIYSPPPSPGLPALVARPRKVSNTPRPSRVFRVLGWIAGLVVFLYVARVLVRRGGGVDLVGWEKTGDFEMVGQYDLPEFPTPIAVTDRHGRSKWTVSIPPTYNFPLTTKEYSDICAKCHEVAAHVRELQGQTYPSPQAQLDYYYQDPYFVDVLEAENRGLLPGAESKAWHVATHSQGGHLVGESIGNFMEAPVCKSSMIFVLESPEAGIGPTLMMLWMAYGLAQKEKRAFFIDDTRWAYGEYTGIFQAPPIPDCRPPPRHEMLPCPRHARHLVVSVATARETFGNGFDSEFEQVEKQDANRERPMYDLARAGYEALFHLNDEDKGYVNNRIAELKLKAKVGDGSHNDGTIVGVHVRHGDQHPYEYQYSATYMPLTRYVETIQQVLDDAHNTSMPNGGEDTMAKKHSFTVLASDNPDVYEADEFSGAVRAQERIKLASVSHTKAEEQNPHYMHKFKEETFGWEGGFFGSMFWNLGRSSNNNAEVKTPESLAPSAETTRLRSLIGRSYMMDLAVLGQGADVVICTVSSAGCRMVGVIMGWEKAMEKGNWMNIDGNYMWTGVALN